MQGAVYVGCARVFERARSAAAADGVAGGCVWVCVFVCVVVCMQTSRATRRLLPRVSQAAAGGGQPLHSSCTGTQRGRGELRHSSCAAHACVQRMHACTTCMRAAHARVQCMHAHSACMHACSACMHAQRMRRGRDLGKAAAAQLTVALSRGVAILAARAGRARHRATAPWVYVEGRRRGAGVSDDSAVALSTRREAAGARAAAGAYTAHPGTHRRTRCRTAE